MRPSNALPAVYLCRDVVDFRKGINGLAVLVEDALQQDVFRAAVRVLQPHARQDQDPVLGAQRFLFVAEASGTGALQMAAQG